MIDVKFNFKAEDLKDIETSKIKLIRSKLYKKIKNFEASPDTLKMLGAIKSELNSRKERFD
jgi:hypothetical protein